MATIHQPASFNAALAMLPSLPRPMLTRLVARMIERIDEIDGDSDLEEDNEDCSGDQGEPDYRKRRRHRKNESGPGCKLSDTDFGGEEIGEPTNGIVHPAYGIDQTRGPLHLTPTETPLSLA